MGLLGRRQPEVANRRGSVEHAADPRGAWMVTGPEIAAYAQLDSSQSRNFRS